MSSASNHQTQGSLLLLHDCLAGRAAGSGRLVLALDAAELLGVGQDEVHVAVVGEHLTDELARVLQRHAHPVVDLRRVRQCLLRQGQSLPWGVERAYAYVTGLEDKSRLVSLTMSTKGFSRDGEIGGEDRKN